MVLIWHSLSLAHLRRLRTITISAQTHCVVSFYARELRISYRPIR